VCDNTPLSFPVAVRKQELKIKEVGASMVGVCGYTGEALTNRQETLTHGGPDEAKPFYRH
jgi:hypothetical protein